MRFVYVTDLHVRGTAPRRRADAWPETPLGKVRQVVDLARSFGAQFVVCGGDVFDSPRPSIEVLAGFIAAARGVEWLTAVGNHDEVGHAVETYKSGALGILEQLDWFSVLGGVEGRSRMWVRQGPDPIIIRGFHYYHGIDSRREFLVTDDPAYEDAIKVAVVHSMIVPDARPYDHVLIEDVDTDAHFVLCSHTHEGWPPKQRDDGVWFLHPGAMVRLSISDADRQPGVLLIDLGARPIAVSWAPLVAAFADEVFDYATAEDEKGWDKRIGDFLARMEEGVAGGLDLTWRIDRLAKELELEPEVLDEIRDRLGALNAKGD